MGPGFGLVDVRRIVLISACIHREILLLGDTIIDNKNCFWSNLQKGS